MKTFATFLVALFLVLASEATAQDIKKQIGETAYDNAVANLLVGLNSTNDGLRRSAIYRLGQFEARTAAIPLMGILRNSTDEKSRIAAAWALCKIGNAVGTYAVKQAVRFDESKKVQLHSAWYYNLYVSEGTFAFVPVENGAIMVAEVR
jgi:hypothetical protein